MDTPEWKNEFWPKLTGLWPDLELTSHQIEQWAKALKPYDLKIALQALELLYHEGTRYKDPRLNEVKAKCRAMAESSRPSGPRQNSGTLADSYRAQWREFQGLSDGEILMCHRQWEWEITCVHSGAYSRHAVGAWLRWQAAAEDAGFPAHTLWREPDEAEAESARALIRRAVERFAQRTISGPRRVLRATDEACELYRRVLGDELEVDRARTPPELARELRNEVAP